MSGACPVALPPGAAAILGRGTLYLDAGNSTFSTNLWRISLPSGQAAQLTRNPRQDGISNFSASPAGLVMGDCRPAPSTSWTGSGTARPSRSATAAALPP